MSALQGALEGLFRFLAQQGLVPPSREVWLVEVGSGADVDERGRPQVRRADFRDPRAYEPRFEALLAAGLPWLNVSCYGLDGNRLVVVVETPRASGASAVTPVNYSGPTTQALARGLNISDVVDHVMAGTPEGAGETNTSICG